MEMRYPVGYLYEGLGRMGGEKAQGPGGFCVCPKCGEEIPHETGKPCFSEECPECGAKMAAKGGKEEK